MPVEEEQLEVHPHDDGTVIIRQPREACRDPQTIISVNCPDKTGLGCDLCRILLLFGLSIVRGDASTDGKWCYVVFWVVGRRETRWGLLKRRLMEACPSVLEIYGFRFSGEVDIRPRPPPQLFLLTFSCSHLLGLLHDVTRMLCDLELTIRKVKVSTTPDGRLVNLFFLTDNRELLHTKRRKADVSCKLHEILDDTASKIEIEQASAEIAASCMDLPTQLSQKISSLDLPHGPNINVQIAMDNSLSPSHTHIQISCQDQKGLLYDITRTLKDFNIQLSYGRFFASPQGKCEIDLFVVQPDGKKITEPCKQEALRSRLRSDLLCPMLVMLVDRGPDRELLVANPVEVSGRGRPLVFHDITLALKSLRMSIFLAESGRHMVGDREWEVYRILLSDGCQVAENKDLIEGCVITKLMGRGR